MKNTVYIRLFALLFLFPVSLKAQNWVYSFEDAQKMSKAINKPILVDFWASWCAPCIKMDMEVWSKQEVKTLMQNYVPAKIDFDLNRLLTSRYSVRGIPYILILDSWGNILYQSIGYKKKNEISKLLNTYILDLTSINKEMTLLDKDKKNAAQNIRVAEAFQEVAFSSNDKVKHTLIGRANKFLKKAKKYVSKEDKIALERIKLLKLVSIAYRKSYKSVMKSLMKKFKDRQPSNDALYYYLAFYCFHKQDMKEDADKMYQKLIKSEEHTKYLEKADSFSGK